MKKIGEIMKEMGFNPEASEGSQKAFIKYLLRVANNGKLTPEPAFFEANVDPEEWQELKTHSHGCQKPESQNVPQQLSFSFEPANDKTKVG